MSPEDTDFMSKQCQWSTDPLLHIKQWYFTKHYYKIRHSYWCQFCRSLLYKKLSQFHRFSPTRDPHWHTVSQVV